MSTSSTNDNPHDPGARPGPPEPAGVLERAFRDALDQAPDAAAVARLRADLHTLFANAEQHIARSQRQITRDDILSALRSPHWAQRTAALAENPHLDRATADVLHAELVRHTLRDPVTTSGQPLRLLTRRFVVSGQDPWIARTVDASLEAMAVTRRGRLPETLALLLDLPALGAAERRELYDRVERTVEAAADGPHALTQLGVLLVRQPRTEPALFARAATGAVLEVLQGHVFEAFRSSGGTSRGLDEQGVRGWPPHLLARVVARLEPDGLWRGIELLRHLDASHRLAILPDLLRRASDRVHAALTERGGDLVGRLTRPEQELLLTSPRRETRLLVVGTLAEARPEALALPGNAARAPEPPPGTAEATRPRALRR